MIASSSPSVSHSSDSTRASLKVTTRNEKGDKIRQRLLRQLGIVRNEKEEIPSRLLSSFSSQKVAPFSIPLKYDEEEAQSNQKAMDKVGFDNTVEVIPIPCHKDYSERFRNRLWCSPLEMRSMATRNTFEFRAEGWDWRTVTEDEDMVVSASGERIHPIHVQRLWPAMTRRQVKPIDQPQRRSLRKPSSSQCSKPPLP